MVSLTATPGGDSLGVDVAWAAPTSLQAPQPIPPTGFVSCPTQHGLGRSNDENLLQAIVSSISYRLEKLSLSDEPVLESPTTAVCYPVYTATPAGTDPTPSKHSARPSLCNIKPKLLGKLSNALKAGLQKSIQKRANAKKTRAPISPLPVSPCSPVEHEASHIGHTVASRGGLLLSDALEANPDRRDTFAFAAQAPPTHETVNTTFFQLGSSDASPSTPSTLWTAGDEVADDTMDEDEQQAPSARSDSPMPMELEPTSPSSDATLVPESPSVPSEDSTCRDVPSSIPEPRDEIMSDEEQCPSNSEVADRMEPADTIMIDAPSAESASSTMFSKEIDMADAEDPKSPSPLVPLTTSFVQPTQTPPASDDRSQLPMPETNSGRDSLPSSVVETRRQVAASPSGRAPSTVSATDKVLSTWPTSLPAVAGRQPGPKAILPFSVVVIGRQVAASPSGRAPSTLSATGKVDGPPGSIPTQAGTPLEAAMDGVESGRRAIKGSRRVARAMAKTKVTWQAVQRMARQSQAALKTAQFNAAASTSATSLKSDEEELRLSQQWHAAQPPPPPEAMPYINTDQEEYDGDGEEYNGDPDDIDAQIAWALSH